MTEPLYVIEHENAPTYLLEYVLRRHPDGRGGARRLMNEHEPRLVEFREWCDQVFEAQGIPVKWWRFWCSILTKQDTDGEWCAGFPHNHSWDGTTLVLFLRTPEEGGDLVVLENEEEVARVSPKVGRAAIIGGRDDHGVERIASDDDRVVIIATGFPNDREEPFK